jgi:3',5'-cyclic AMP phosphodiesterase CpdA
MASNTVPSYRVAHISDPHLPPPAFRNGWRDLLSKRSLSRFAWRRKGHRHSPKVLAALIADLKANAPDHVAVTGDLTNFSTPEEYAAARNWLVGLGDPRDVTVSPGNHDALTGERGPARFAPWAPWLGDDANGFPHIRVRGPVAIVNLCSAVPTRLHLAQGELGADQIARAEAELKVLGEAGFYRLVLVHHPITDGAVSGRKSLVDAPALRAALGRAGAELVLHGHAHEALVNSAGGVPVLGVPSASATGEGHDEPARWHAIEIEKTGAGFTTRVIARGLDPSGEVVEKGRYVLTG